MDIRYTDLFRGSREEARQVDAMDLWAHSLAENVACAKAIDKAL